MQLIINPSAGAGRGYQRTMAHAAKLREVWPGIEISVSEDATALVERVRRAADDARCVLVAGGDGTVNLAVNALAGRDVTLGVLPVGTGNDIAYSVGVPRAIDEAIALLGRGEVCRVDMGEVEGRYFCCVLGVGMDSPALERINAARWLRRGRLLYTLAALRTLLTYRPRPARIRHDGGVYEGAITFAAITNTESYAGGMTISPGAEVADGLLDLCIFPEMSRLRTLRAFAAVATGRHAQLPEIVTLRSAEFTLESLDGAPLRLTLDGELTSLKTPQTVRVRRGGLALLGDPAAIVSRVTDRAQIAA